MSKTSPSRKSEEKKLKEKEHRSRSSESRRHSKSKRHHRSGGGFRCAKMIKKILWAVLIYFISLFHLIKDKLLTVLFEYLTKDNRKLLPPLPKDVSFLSKSAIELADMIRRKELKSYDLVKAYIDRLNEINPILNAIVDGPVESALDKAKEIDDQIANGKLSNADFEAKPFLGVPFSTKDSTEVEGLLYTLGLRSRRTERGRQDAECVRLMKEAGGIFLVKTNIPEVNRWQETRNSLIGQTNNPYDNRRTVGGSSGGEGAIISACGIGFGLGTDIGGSIRMPAYYCGIFGHKPTVGIINTRGCTMRTGKEPSTMVVAGPMTRHATDLLPMLKCLVEPSKKSLLRLNDTVDIKKLKFYYIRSSGELRTSPVCNDLQSAMTRVINHLTQITDEAPKEITLSHINNTSKMWRYWMTKEPGDGFPKLLGNGQKVNPFVELFRKLTGTSEFTLASIYSLLDGVLPAENEDKIKEFTRKCDEELTNILGDDGILLYHNAPRVAPFHYDALVNIYNFTYWCLFNVLHVPATQCPLGLNEEGLPVGIQVVATRNRDRHCLAVAVELEKALNGWVAPFVTDK